MQALAIVLALAVVVESVVNLLMEDVPNPKAKKYVAFALGIAMTVLWRVGILSTFAFPMPSALTTYADYVITGIFVSRGSNYIHKLVETIGLSKNPPSDEAPPTNPTT